MNAVVLDSRTRVELLITQADVAVEKEMHRIRMKRLVCVNARAREVERHLERLKDLEMVRRELTGEAA